MPRRCSTNFLKQNPCFHHCYQTLPPRNIPSFISTSEIMSGSGSTAIHKLRRSDRIRAKKARDSGCAEVEDRLSNLPEGVIDEIISLLPVKDLVRTCVLSKFWEHKWTSGCNVNIVENDLLSKPPSHNKVMFVQFMDRLLLHLRSIKNFYLSVSCFEEHELHRLTKWIHDLSKHKIESIELEVKGDHWMVIKEHPILPLNLLNCDSMKSASLKNNRGCKLEVAVATSFPKLTSLCLCDVKILNEHSNSETLIFTFPLLKEFELERCEWLKVEFVEINAPSMKKFKYVSSFRSNGDEKDNHLIKIVEVKLEDLFVVGSSENISLAGSKAARVTLTNPYRHIGSEYRKLLRELSHVKSMDLWGVFKAIGQSELGPPLPKFRELEELTVASPFDNEELLELLHAVPFLRLLRLYEVDVDIPYDYDAVEYVPSCIASHLKTLSLDYSQCVEPKHHLAKFMLRNGLQLQYVFIQGSRESPTNKIVKQLLEFPQGSTCVSILGLGM